jgi:hypothetical protein
MSLEKFEIIGKIMRSLEKRKNYEKLPKGTLRISYAFSDEIAMNFFDLVLVTQFLFYVYDF